MPVVSPARDWSMAAPAQIEYARRHNVLGAGEEGPVAVKAPADCPDEPAIVDVRIDRGVPIAVNHVEMPFRDLVTTLATIATAHGVADPPAVVLQVAHNALQRLATTPDVDRFARVVGREYADIIDAGLWFTPLRRALDKFVAAAQDVVTGVVRMKLYKGVFETTANPEPAPPKPLPLVAIR